MAARRPQRSGSSRGAAPRGGASSRGGASRSSGASRGGNTRGGATRGSSARGGAPRSGGARRPRRDEGPRHGAASGQKGIGGDQLEGRHAVREALIAQGRKVREIWIANDLDDADIIEDIVELAQSQRVQVLEVPRRKLEDTARSEAPQGIIAFAAPLKEHELDDLMETRGSKKPFLVAIDGVTDPGNFGALLRCCEGSGVTGVIVPRHRSVHVTPTVVKTAAGAVEYVPMSLVSGLPNAITQMKQKGIWVVGLDDAADKSLFEIGSLAQEGVCIVLGAEGAGLSRLVRERCDMIVSIPMLGQLSSLNVSAAAALATYEVARVRGAGRA